MSPFLNMSAMGMKLDIIDGGPVYGNGSAIAPEVAGIGATPRLSVIGEPIKTYE